jgi:ribonuclease HI
LSSAAAQTVPKVVVHIDGGARGNPGPAAIGVVVSDSAGAILDEFAETIGVATNNVAEYTALLRGVERAAAFGPREVEFVNDSELVAKQINGTYKVKHPAMKPLHEQATSALRHHFDGHWRIRSVPRAQNARADALVNEALDGLR